MFKHILMAGLGFGMVGIALPAHAANCAMRDMVVERLESQYSEQLTAGGLQSSQTATTFVEVWASSKTGTFTVILTTPQGLSCILASGTDWFTQELVAQVQGIPS